MRKLFYMGLEAYEGRYTLQLTDWNASVFDKRNINWVNVPGTTIDDTKSISVGQVLDAHGRSYFAMSQMMNLVQMMRNGEVTGMDTIFFEDMFQPGMESLPYIMDQIPEQQRPQVWVRCLAQAIDPDDFVHVWGMSKWMSLYEKMCNEFVTGVLASNEEMVANMKVAGWTAPIYNISGLAFDTDEVRSRVQDPVEFRHRPRRVAFSSRWDQEKQPHWFMDLIELHASQDNANDIEWMLMQGGPLRSNDPSAVSRARKLEQRGLLTIRENLKKDEYYQELGNSRVLFNCALQDWTSNTVSEADALGTNVVFPAYRSFPEIFNNTENRLYVPWSESDALAKIKLALLQPDPAQGEISTWTSGTVGRYVDIMLGNGEQWRRDGVDYRQHTRMRKY
jgi:hypothetical protein